MKPADHDPCSLVPTALSALCEDPNVATPHLVYFESELIDRLQRLRRGLAHGLGRSFEVQLAVKSCYCPPVLRAAAAAGCGAEVMSALEYRLAQAAGFPARRILLHGLARSRELLEEAATSGACIFAETEEDVRHLADIGRSRKVRVAIRVQAHLGLPSTHFYDQPNGKLGLDPGSSYFDGVISQLAASPGVVFAAIHAHFTINQKDSSVFTAAAEHLAKHLRTIEARLGRRFEAVDLGGGFGTFARPEAAQAETFFKLLGESARTWLPDRMIWLEPGRYLTNSCGYLIATVLDRKPLSNHLTLIVVDAGTNVLIPVSTATYSLVQPSPMPGGVVVTIADGITSPNNLIVEKVAVAIMPKVGDRIILGNTGAYTAVFSHYWAYEPCTIGFVGSDGRHQFTLTRSDLAEARRRLLGI
jgi:diaminopimelate decarboxylase